MVACETCHQVQRSPDDHDSLTSYGADNAAILK